MSLLFITFVYSVHDESNANKGIATETQGREDNPDLYENDVLGKVAKRKKNDIWSCGGEKRTKFKNE